MQGTDYATRRISFCFTIIAVIACSVSTSQAGVLTGQTLSASSNFGLAPPSSIVGAGVEFSDSFGDLDFDFDENGFLDITFVRSFTSGHNYGSGFSVSFTDVFGTIDDIVGFTLLSVDSGITGVEQSDLSFTSDTITFAIGDTTWSNRGGVAFPVASMKVEFASDTGQVPEPTSLAIFGLGALGLAGGAIRRRKKQLA